MENTSSKNLFPEVKSEQEKTGLDLFPQTKNEDLQFGLGASYDEADASYKAFLSGAAMSSETDMSVLEDSEQFQSLQKQVAQGQHDLVRSQAITAANKRLDKENKQVMDRIINSESSAENRVLALKAINEVTKQSLETVLEQEAVEQLRETSLKYPKMAKQILERPDFFERQDNITKRRLVLESLMMDLKAKSDVFEKEHPVQDAISELTGFFLETFGDIAGEMTLFPGTSFYNSAMELRSIQDPEELRRKAGELIDRYKGSRVFWDNDEWTMEYMENVLNKDKAGASMQNFFTVLELGLWGAGTAASRMGRKGLQSATGNKEQVSKEVLEEIKAKSEAIKRGEDPTKVTLAANADKDETMRHLSSQLWSDVGENASSQIKKDLENNEIIMQEILSEVAGNAGRMTDEELQEIVKKAEKRVRLHYTEGRVGGVYYDFDPELGVHYSVVKLQKADGTFYDTFEEAVIAATAKKVEEVFVGPPATKQKINTISKITLGQETKGGLRAYIRRWKLSDKERAATYKKLEELLSDSKRYRGAKEKEFEETISRLEAGLKQRKGLFSPRVDLDKLNFSELSDVEQKIFLDLQAQKAEKALEAMGSGESLSHVDLYVPKQVEVPAKHRVGTLSKKDPETGETIVDDSILPKGTYVRASEDGSGYYIEKRKVINETGHHKEYTDEDLPISSRLRIMLFEPASYAAKSTVAGARSASQAESMLTDRLVNLKKKVFNKASKTQLRNIESVINDGRDWLNADGTRGKWFNRNEFDSIWVDRFGKEPTDLETAMYFTYRQISDTEWMIRNINEYRQNSAKGWSTVNLRNPKSGQFEAFNGKLFDTPAALKAGTSGKKRVRFIDPKTGKRSYAEEGKVEELYKEGYVFIERQTKSPINGVFAPYELVKKSDVSSSPLKFTQIGYQQGGHVAYTGRWFISQRVKGTFEDGTQWYGPLITRFNALTKGQADDFVANIERARIAHNDYLDGKIDLGVYEEAVSKTFYGTTDKFEDAIDVGEILKDQEFKVRFDGEDEFIPKLDANGNPVEDYTTDMSVSSSYNHGRGQMYYSKRGERLKDTYGEEAAVMDSFDTQSRAVGEAISSYAWDDFAERELARFDKTFRRYIKNGDTLTPMEMLDAELMDRVGDDIKRQFMAQRLYLKGQLRIPGMSDKAVRSAIKGFGQWVEGKGRNIVGDDMAASIANKAYNKTSANPVTWLRGITYDLHLGAFNIPQLILQAQSAVAATTMHPKHGMTAWKNSLAFRYAIMGNKPEIVREMALRNKWANRTDIDDFMESVNEFRRSGMHVIGHSLSTIDIQPTAVFNNSKLQSLRQHGRFFAQEGDRWSRIIAWGIARERARDLGIDITSRDGRKWMVDDTERLLLGMTAANNTVWQRGLSSLPTQFWQHSIKMLSAMTPRKFGGSRMYSRAEKLRLITGQTVLYGSMGYPFLAQLQDKVFRETGAELDPTLYKFVTNGIIDGLMYAASGGEIDVDFATVGGTGQFIPRLFQTLSEEPTVVPLTGVSGKDVSKGITNIVKYADMMSLWENPNPEAAAKATWHIAKNMISSLNKFDQAVLIATEGRVAASNGETVADKINPWTALITGLSGAMPSPVNDTYKFIRGTKEYQESTKNYAKMVVELRARAMNADSDEEQESYHNLQSYFFYKMDKAHGWEVTRDIENQARKWQSKDPIFIKSFKAYVDRSMKEDEYNNSKINFVEKKLQKAHEKESEQ